MLETAGTQTIYYTMAIGVYHMLWRGLWGYTPRVTYA